MSRIAVIGGTGFIGRHVIRWLADAGEDVVVIHRGQTAARVPGVVSLAADRHDSAALANAVAKAAPAVLVDMTSYTKEDMERLLRAMPSSMEHLIVISSGDVYSNYAAFLGSRPAVSRPGVLDEQAPVREGLFPYRGQATGPDDLRYSYEKILVERSAQAGAGVPVTILRLPMVYGPGDSQRRVAGLIDRLRASGSRLPLNLLESQWRCTRGYVEDVAWAIRLAALDVPGTGRIFNLGEPDALTEIEWIQAVAAAAGWAGTVVPDPEAPPSIPADWRIPLVADTSRIRAALGYREPVGRSQGLQRTVAALH